MDSIQVTNYEMNTGLGLRLALVTDLHSMPYDDLLVLLLKERPDAILLAGDTLERHKEGGERVGLFVNGAMAVLTRDEKPNGQFDASAGSSGRT